MVNHLSLSVKKHSGGLTEVFSGVKPLTHTVIMKTLAGILKNVNTVDGEGLSGLEKDLLGMEESFSHSLDLLVIMMINLTAMVEHVTNIRYGETELINCFSGLLE